MKVLIVEDEPVLRKLEKNFLEKKGFVVDGVTDGKEALSMLKLNEYDCVLLDLNIPGKDGISVSKEIRRMGKDVPIIMVTARSQIYDKLEGFDSGADDYITKPFDMKELVARVNAVIKRSSINQEEIIKLGDMEIYPEKNTVSIGSLEKELTNREMGILEYLVRNKGRIISPEELLEHVWDSNVDMFTDTVKTHIKTLRKKIDPKKKFIKTIRGKGYVVR
ncbi:MAG: response regulator transcription factor [Candidatus Dojkabacteria bacterium]|jgi:DNA-binding response OmpR family regulator|nr:response regulator transcription factor [Candidatus Dojkabacteria bacterium]